MLPTLTDVLNDTNPQHRSLLLGNGFSSRYFSYKTLLEKSSISEHPSIMNLFTSSKTNDFEAVVNSLEAALPAVNAYGMLPAKKRFVADSKIVRESLVHAIRMTHPLGRNELGKSYDIAWEFIRTFSSVFTLNYDLLLYWLNLKGFPYTDGFARGHRIYNDSFIGPFDEDAPCSMYNLHGGLHLFQSPDGDIIKALDGSQGMIDTISDAITKKGMMPIYVAEGSSPAKLKKIKSDPYLRFCLRALKSNHETMIVFGHGASIQDAHIYDAIFSSGCKKMYYGVFQPNKFKINRIEATLAAYRINCNKRVEFELYDSTDSNIWGI